MLISNLQKAIVLVVILSFSFFSFSPSIAQVKKVKNTIDDPVAAAERDAELDTNKMLWFGAGCLGGLTGLLIAYLYEPSPPAIRLVGKSSEYVAIYTDVYKRKAKSIQTHQALTGCGCLAGFYVVYVMILISSSTYESRY